VDTPSETSERLSEAVGALRAKAEGLLEELDRLEARLEAAEVQEIALREAAREEKGRADALRAELDAGRSGGRGEERRRGRRRGPSGG
jgi:chromosome segregation ATPase